MPEPRSLEFCPKCGGDLPEDTVWLVRSKFYCGEVCAKKARDYIPDDSPRMLE